MLVEAALVRVGNHAGVHQRRRGVAILLAEICADQLLPFVADAGQRQIEQPRDFREPPQEDLAGLPVPGFEIGHDVLQLAANFLVAKRQHLVDQPLGASGVRPVALPGKMERPYHNTRWVGLQPQWVEFRMNHDPIR